MTTQQKAWTNLGFHDLDQYYLARGLKTLEDSQPKDEPEPEPEPAQVPPCDPTVKDYKGVSYVRKAGNYMAQYYCSAEGRVFYIGYRDTVKQTANLRAKWIAVNYPELDL